MTDLEPMDKELEKIIEVGTRMLKRHAHGEQRMRELHEAGDFEPPCHDGCEGWIRYEDGGETLIGPCPLENTEPPCLIPARTRRIISGDLGGLGWPSRYLEESRWEDCPVESELRAIPSNAGILLLGPVGTGKTSAAALRAKQQWPRQKMAYVYWGHLVEQLGKGLPDIARQPALCVDDYGVGQIPDWKLGSIDHLWEYRNSRRLPTIVTSNQTQDELMADEISSRWVDRWRQLLPFVVTISGDSKR